MPPRIDIPKSVLEKLYYGDKLNRAQIAAKLGHSPTAIQNRMNEYGMVARPIGRVPLDLPYNDLYDMYVTQDMRAEEIAVHFGCSVPTVLKKLRAYHIPIRPSGPEIRQWVSDELYTTWTCNDRQASDIAYALGLLASDGNLNKSSSEVSLSSIDKELVDLYCRCLNLDPAVLVAYSPGRLSDQSHRRPKYTVAFSDRRFRAFVDSIGLTPTKSKTLGPLNIPDVVFPDFARGCWDGDGTWNTQRNRPPRQLNEYLRTALASASPQFLAWMGDSIKRLTGLQGGVSGICLYFYSKNAIKLGSWLYRVPSSEMPTQHPAVPALSRKYIIWHRFAVASC